MEEANAAPANELLASVQNEVEEDEAEDEEHDTRQIDGSNISENE
jgi:hypothetical protein